jgi:hypothetical protein
MSWNNSSHQVVALASIVPGTTCRFDYQKTLADPKCGQPTLLSEDMCLCGDNLHLQGRVRIDGHILEWQRVLEEKPHHPTVETMGVMVVGEEQAVILKFHQTVYLERIVS